MHNSLQHVNFHILFIFDFLLFQIRWSNTKKRKKESRKIKEHWSCCVQMLRVKIIDREFFFTLLFVETHNLWIEKRREKKFITRSVCFFFTPRGKITRASEVYCIHLLRKLNEFQEHEIAEVINYRCASSHFHRFIKIKILHSLMEWKYWWFLTRGKSRHCVWSERWSQNSSVVLLYKIIRFVKSISSHK